jgi:hypothetical protein
VVPVIVPENVITAVEFLLQSVWLLIVFTDGVGLTVIIKVCAAPLHPFANGITETVPVTGVVPVLAAENEGMLLPVPLAPSPIPVFVFVHEKVAPETALVKVSAIEDALLHTA